MSKAVSKKERAARVFQENLQILRCPICSAAFAPKGGGIQCGNSHSFDLARKGYLNFLMSTQNKQYGKDLFLARKEVFAAGVYDPLVEEAALIVRRLGFAGPYVLDAGCGEGSFLARIHERLESARLIGMDISRDGIHLAASHGPAVMWCVADLPRLPLTTGSIDIVFNILSPANYGEFRRVLRPGGVLIKVVPGPDYLREIRSRLEGITAYSNEKVLAKLEENMEIQSRSVLQYQVRLTDELWQLIVKMTPLTQHRKLSGAPPRSVTMDFELIQAII